MSNNTTQSQKCWALLPNLHKHELQLLADSSTNQIKNKMKKIELWLYVIGTVIIIKAAFRLGLADGFWMILAGIGCIFLAYYIGKHIRRS